MFTIKCKNVNTIEFSPGKKKKGSKRNRAVDFISLSVHKVKSLYTCSVNPCASLASVEVLLTILKTEDTIHTPHRSLSRTNKHEKSSRSLGSQCGGLCQVEVSLTILKTGNRQHTPDTQHTGVHIESVPD